MLVDVLVGFVVYVASYAAGYGLMCLAFGPARG